MNEICTFIFNSAMRSLAVAGYSFFGLIVATHDYKICLTASAIAAGSYFFTELVRYFKINPNEVVITKNNKNKFTFMIFP